MNDYLTKAILLLKPNAEFSYIDDDYTTIKWDVLEGEAPTQAEIDAAIEQVKANEIAEAQAKAQAKAVLLERLGLTQEEFNTLTA
jgi:thymidine phosphorylase